MADPPRPDRIALSREYSDFLIELSIAVHKFGMYPSGHPSLDPVAVGVAARAAQLLTDRPQVAFGVARRQLIIEGVATSAEQPVLRRLAETLHRHHLGAVSVLRGIEPAEIGEALRALSVEPEQHGPLGTQRTARLTWPHLRLHALSFDGLALSAGPPTDTGEAGEADTSRGAALWLGLARAALTRDGGDAPAVSADTDPDLIARAIGEQSRAAAYDQVIIGYLLQISREIKSSTSADAAALKRRTARLIGALGPETLRRLVAMGGDLAARREFVIDASQNLAVEAVLDIVKAAADVSGQTISHGLVRLLSKLAVHAELGEAGSRPFADVALREQVGRLLVDWNLADPNPEAYGTFLQELSTSRPGGPRPGAAVDARAGSTDGRETDPRMTMADRDHALDPVRLVQMGLEVGDPGVMVDRAVARVVADGRVAEILTLVAESPMGADRATERIRRSLVEPAVLRAMLEQPTADIDHLEPLQPLMSEASYEVLLDVLATTDNRTRRRKLIDRLSRAPVDLGPTIVTRLDDTRWFVQRNMLVLLERIGRVPPGLSLDRWTSHSDIRVRHEAIRLQLTVPAERHLAVRAALQDGHPRLVHSGLAALRHECPSEVADLVGALAVDAEASMDLRVMAAQALGKCRDARALESLVELTAGGRSLLGRPKLAVRSPVMLAALQALAGSWRTERRAMGILALAAESSDPEIQRAVQVGRR